MLNLFGGIHMKIGSYLDFRKETQRAIEWGKENYQKWPNLLTEEQKNTIYEYMIREGGLINSYLSGTAIIQDAFIKSKIDDDIKTLDKLLNTVTLPENVILYRLTDVLELNVKNQYGELITNEDLRPDEKKLNLETADIIANYFSENDLGYKGYLTTKLALDSQILSLSDPVILKIMAPSCSNVGYVSILPRLATTAHMVVKRGYILEVNSVQIVDIDEKQFLEITVYLL